MAYWYKIMILLHLILLLKLIGTRFYDFDGSRYIPLSVLKSKDFIFPENK